MYHTPEEIYTRISILMAVQHSIILVYCTLFTQFAAVRHVVLFPLFTIINDTAKNILLHIPDYFFGSIPGSRNAESTSFYTQMLMYTF